MVCQWPDINVCCRATEQECLVQGSQIIDLYLFIQVERSCYLSMWPLTNQELCFGCRAIQTGEKKQLESTNFCQESKFPTFFDLHP